MSAAMSLNVREYNAGDKAAPSLCPRDHSSTLGYMAEQKSSQARLPEGLAGPWSLERPHRDTPRVPDGRDRKPALPGRNDQWTIISASSSPRVDAGCITWRKEVDDWREQAR